MHKLWLATSNQRCIHLQQSKPHLCRRERNRPESIHFSTSNCWANTLPFGLLATTWHPECWAETEYFQRTPAHQVALYCVNISGTAANCACIFHWIRWFSTIYHSSHFASQPNCITTPFVRASWWVNSYGIPNEFEGKYQLFILRNITEASESKARRRRRMKHEFDCCANNAWNLWRLSIIYICWWFEMTVKQTFELAR